MLSKANVNLHVVDWGGEGIPMLYIPSWNATSHVYEEFVPRFTDKYRVLVLELRGHGESSKPDYGYAIERLIQNTGLLLDELGIQQVVLIGLSRSASLITHLIA